MLPTRPFFPRFSGLQESNETLREALLSLHQDHDTLRQSSIHLQQLLDALETLLGIEEDSDPFSVVFASLRKVFSFSHVLMLAEVEDSDHKRLDCIISERSELLNSQWPVGALFAKIMSGKVVTTFSSKGISEWDGAETHGLSRESPVLYVPVRVRDRRGILLLIREARSEGFSRDEIALAKRFSVVVSHALATRYASQNAAEGRRLREMGEQLRKSEQMAQRNSNLLKEIVDALPVGVLVQHASGEPLVINEFAEKTFGKHATQLPSAIHPAKGMGSGLSPIHSLTGSLEQDFNQSFEYETVIDGEKRVMLVSSSHAHIFDESLQITTSMDITGRKRSEDELHHRAYHDQLTDLPNRSLMKQTVEWKLLTIKEGEQFALAFIDIDNFKQVNDFYSHALGDQLLLAITRRIQDIIGERDMLSRISGDEFLLLIGDVTSEAGVTKIVDAIVDELRRPFMLEGQEVFSSASIGVSIYPLHGNDYETLRRSADNAMYRAKSAHKGSAAYFDDTMRDALTARMETEQKLRAAIRDRHFKAAYQPKTDIETGRIEGFEALVRWVEPNGTIHMPGNFIGIAGELGLIGEITHFMLDEITRDLPAMKQKFGDNITLSLNVAARQANSPDFMRLLLQRIEAAGVGQNLIVELTEEALVSARFFQNDILPSLRQLGVRISIDDFGTGFSSLSILADIDADELKVDRAFIMSIHERPRSQDILKAIESVCAALGIGMVAEGVELREELDYLAKNTKIRLVQGYFFGKPAFPETFLSGSALSNFFETETPVNDRQKTSN
ncbi:putative bifunctional diguanylate cyclase/phosphodiesterase [Agrobacterium sp. Azo12]|uniref:putative bifunctional diguanylate cyclase/phosphodiesterase n=1 Tax=Agrobacterium sp. Azo12 TaxID=3031129 RepID=UPI0023D8A585|nr:EAL domain-containing protein [Agrobacterium sp. Azo12]MDO5898007.1 EAL domain-containing protein [Agrobacterium sp. Azo12]